MPSITPSQEPTRLPVLGNPEKGCGCKSTTEHGYGKTYWRSIEEKLGSPDFQKSLEREFPEGATLPPQGLERREFLSLLGASLALAGLSACTARGPDEKILPYTRTPPNLAPGNPLHFASAFMLDGYANGLLVTSWEGRPTKIEGNPDHPFGKGTTGVFEQAAVIGLYDPQRASLVKEKKQAKAWRSFLKATSDEFSELKKDGGARLRFLIEPTTSPLMAEMRSRVLQTFPKAKFYSYGFSTEDNARAGAELAFGRRLDARPDLQKADVILSLDGDFLNPTPRNLREVASFAARRVPSASLNRLYVAESALTTTGSMADHRLRVRASEIQAVALAVLSQLPGYGSLQPTVQKLQLTDKQSKWTAAVAKDLLQHKGRSLVVAGDRQPVLVHALVHAMNAALGNAEQTVRYFDPILIDDHTGTDALKALVSEIQQGQVHTLVVTAHNPAYASPSDLGLAQALEKVPNVIYRGLFEDETFEKARWFIPATHFLEQWGDARAVDGSTSLVQPLLAPLFSGYTEVDVLAAFLEEGERGTYAQLRDLWRKKGGTRFDHGWEIWLGEGVVPSTALVSQSPSLQTAKVIGAAQGAPAPNGTGLEVNFALDYKVHDGRYGNIAWLQELAEPISKVTWDNVALISPATAHKLGLEAGDVVELALGERRVNAPVWVAPGHADDAVTVTVGYGRTAQAEQVARGVGFNAFALMQSGAWGFERDLKVTKTGASHELAQTQTHWSMSSRPDDPTVAPRPLALEQTVEEFRAHPELAEEMRKPLPTIQPPVQYDGYKWAMSIDLSRCIGCNACSIACQAENNIPVVGKKQVANGREMQWLRIDRYFEGTLDDPNMITQPVACMHCETAPCEYVCPVNATVHSDEGLNEMIYNRCVGTRYCSNNCPYKVRRFNYLHWTANKSVIEAMGSNPDVTVRDRGVMEKCTYCVQRIERVRISTRIEGRLIKDGDIKTACQQACPANAITFGTLSDAHSQVSKLHQDKRRYDLLHQLNTRPRTAYLLRIRNPNPELA